MLNSVIMKQIKIKYLIILHEAKGQFKRLTDGSSAGEGVGGRISEGDSEFPNCFYHLVTLGQ